MKNIYTFAVMLAGLLLTRATVAFELRTISLEKVDEIVFTNFNKPTAMYEQKGWRIRFSEKDSKTLWDSMDGEQSVKSGKRLEFGIPVGTGNPKKRPHQVNYLLLWAVAVPIVENLVLTGWEKHLAYLCVDSRRRAEGDRDEIEIKANEKGEVTVNLSSEDAAGLLDGWDFGEVGVDRALNIVTEDGKLNISVRESRGDRSTATGVIKILDKAPSKLAPAK
jgi:hypothetical protein